MDFLLLPPEINSARMYAGPGSGPLTAAATAWAALATDLMDSATAFSTVIAEIPWQGPSSDLMRKFSVTYIRGLCSSADKAAQTAIQANAAVAAYEAAFAGTVPPAVVANNRWQLATLVATNILGQNTPAIMATEALYMEMWAQDSSTMTAYSAASTAATAGLDGWTDIFQPGSNQDTTGLSGLFNILSGSTGSSFGSLMNSTFVNSLASGAFFNPGQTVAPVLGLASLFPAFATMTQPQPSGGNNAYGSGGRMPAVPNDSRYPRVSANTGTARSIGNLRAPSSWATAESTPGRVNVGTPMITEEIPPSFPAVMPPIVGNPGGKLERPKYGNAVKVIHQHPSVG